MDPLYIKTTNFNYGQSWISPSNDNISLKELGDTAITLHHLQKSYKSKRKLESNKNHEENTDSHMESNVNEKYKYDKNAIIGKRFPFKAEDFKYKSKGEEKPTTLFIKYSEEYGKNKPNNLELPEKYFPIDNTFTKRFTYNYKNNSLNTTSSYSKVHKAFDSVY